MYIPLHFAEERIEVLHQLIQMHPLGRLNIAAGLRTSMNQNAQAMATLVEATVISK